MTGNSKLGRQFGEEPQDPQEPPQQPPPPWPCSLPKSRADDDSLPATAKLDTSTLVFVDSHAGQIWLVSLSANLVRTSNLPAQLSHRYSYMGISMEDSKLEEFARLIAAWPGLMATADRALIDDGLVLLEHLGNARSLVDVGSGAGLPGIAIKIKRPHLDVTLIEADQSKAAFLVHASAALQLQQVTVVARRAEDAGHDPELREAFDVAVARALAPLPVLVELCLPLVRVGGRLLAQKTEGEDPATATRAIELLGGELSAVHASPSAARGAGTVVEIRKARRTPERYPRRPGVPARKPL